MTQELKIHPALLTAAQGAFQAQALAPPWLQAWRACQFEEFLRRGLPKPRDESWKYTSLAALAGQAFTVSPSAAPPATIDIPADSITDSFRLVFVNGIFSPAHSSLCAEARVHHADLYQQMDILSTESLSVFHWLNGALIDDGLFLSVPDNVALAKPIHLLYLTTAGSAAATMRHPRHIIQLGANSRASVLEEYRGLGGQPYFNNVLTKISVGENARLHYYKLQCETAAAFHIANTDVEQLRDSQFHAYHLAFGGRLNREDLQVNLQQAGAACELSGFYYPQAQQHIDFHTRIDHRYSHTSSRQYYKGMMAEQGRGVFNGKIIVHPQAQHITAAQQNHNLLLSPSAEIDTKPELEVFADNVRCTHGATIGHLDPNALFYLRSRGVPEALARRLLMCGFANTILDSLPEQAIAQYVRKIALAQWDVENLPGGRL